MEFRKTSAFNNSATSSQGIDTDGTYIVVSAANSSTPDAWLYLFNMSGTQLALRDCTNDGTNTHLGDCAIVGSNIYAVCSDYPNTPYDTKVKKYSFTQSAITYVQEYDLGIDKVGEGIEWDGTYFWFVYNDNVIERRDSNFANPQAYTVDFTPSNFATSNGFQTLRFKNGNIFMNVHDGSHPPMVAEFEVDNTNFKLTCIAHHMRPKNCTQGLTFNGDDTLFAARVYGADPDQVVTTKLVPYDNRDKVVQNLYVSNTITVTAGSYTESTSRRKDIFVREGDIVEASLQGHFYVTGATKLRAKLDVASTSPVSASLVQTVASIRTAATSTDGMKGVHIAHFIAANTGILTITLWWHVDPSGAGLSGSAMNTGIVLRIVGSNTD